MPLRYLLCCLIGTLLVFAWGGIAWGGGMYERWMHPLPGGDSLAQAINSATTQSGMYVYPATPDPHLANSETEQDNMQKAWFEKSRSGPLMMIALTKQGQDQTDPRMFVRGALVEFFATSMLVAVIGLAGAGHGPLRRFLTLLAIVTFMNLGTHMVGWVFMSAPHEWTAVLIFDGMMGWTLAGLPAVFFLRSMREGDAQAP